ncbi:hypothetical protein [Nonomuraea gerenzanensis]|uniref:Uncharacterized protein n=1 Tax=Nonomuraea gerenzanensis TaxID=93944 RepID=A0A1M4EJP4_9ACTN|nr:hypothetical protein [Nonomuraea gerenzanensis]UBU10685.1 hypothetical protein LCN96_41110 [Nonomuraea gerenzanensis]SBO99105.1 hypothetical protein BN4615_P8621 [Nonomuraea gerenzanensis]
MSNPQQPELRRSGKASTDSKSADAAREAKGGARRSGRPHGTDKGRKGGGKGGGVPPAQRPQHPE